jgi:thioredoxin 2
MYRCSKCGALNRVPESKPAGEAVCGKCHSPLDVSGAPASVTGDELDRVVASSQVPVLVDVWAPWCGPCKAVAPTVEAFAKERAGKMIVVKLNSDENQQKASQLRIQGIPTFIVFRGGAEVARKSGALPKQMLESWVSSVAG